MTWGRWKSASSPISSYSMAMFSRFRRSRSRMSRFCSRWSEEKPCTAPSRSRPPIEPFAAPTDKGTGGCMNRCVGPAALGVLSALASLSAAIPVMAQTSGGEAAVGGGLQEVVVTATRREERLQDVPISVSAFSQEKLDSHGLPSIDDLTRLSPGVAFERNGMGSSANYNDENSDISIRGIDSQAGTSTTGIYIDDTPVQSRHIGFGTVNVFPALFDLDRVEVLRGPQGTLFGAGAEGGAVRFITPEPGLRGSTGYYLSEVSTTAYGD